MAGLSLRICEGHEADNRVYALGFYMRSGGNVKCDLRPLKLSGPFEPWDPLEYLGDLGDTISFAIILAE